MVIGVDTCFGRAASYRRRRFFSLKETSFWLVLSSSSSDEDDEVGESSSGLYRIVALTKVLRDVGDIALFGDVNRDRRVAWYGWAATAVI